MSTSFSFICKWFQCTAAAKMIMAAMVAFINLSVTQLSQNIKLQLMQCILITFLYFHCCWSLHIISLNNGEEKFVSTTFISQRLCIITTTARDFHLLIIHKMRKMKLWAPLNKTDPCGVYAVKLIWKWYEKIYI